MNEMVPQGAEVSSSIANSEGTVQIDQEFLGGTNFIQFKLDKDKNVLVNDVTGEESSELLVRICGVKMERAMFDEGALVCSSRDSKFSKDGIQCETCPNINNSPLMGGEEQKARYDAACKKNNIENPPEWNAKTKCSFRMVVQWNEQFESDGGQYMWVIQPGLCYLSCPKSSIAAMVFKGTGYLTRLKSKGYSDLKHVVTKIAIGQRRNEKLKTNYSYEIFEMEGTYDAITKKCVNYNEMIKALGGIPQVATTQVSAPQIAQQEEVQPELPQMATPKKGVPKPLAEHTEKFAKPAQAPKAVEAEVAQVVEPTAPAQSSPAEMRMKIKFSYAVLPADVQQIILNVLKVESIDKVVDGDLKVAMETMELAKKEVAGRPVEKSCPAETAEPAVVQPEPTATVGGKPVSAKKLPW